MRMASRPPTSEVPTEPTVESEAGLLGIWVSDVGYFTKGLGFFGFRVSGGLGILHRV